MKHFSSIIWFLAGIGALIFETLWFQTAGLVLGSSVLAAVAVVSSFMTGLALGSLLIAGYGDRIQLPLHVCAALQTVTALSGTAVVVLGPQLSPWLAPLFRPFLDSPTILSFLRFCLAFVLMAAPSSLMGMTLPLFLKGLRSSQSFGVELGDLYGWNTMGSVVGALTGEALLVRWAGIQGAGIFGGGVYLLAASATFLIAVRSERKPAIPEEEVSGRRGLALLTAARPFLVATVLSGCILVAFEMVWFRFLLLFFPPAAIVFNSMLAVILAGVGIGGLCGAWLLRVQPEAPRLVPSLLFGYGIFSVVSYASIHVVLDAVSGFPAAARIALVSSYLMFPASLLSGIVFTMLGAGLHNVLRSEVRTTGLLTGFNTAGALVGAVLASFLFIPVLGLERSFFVLSFLSGAAAFFSGCFPRFFRLAGYGYVNAVAAFGFCLLCLLFPFGRMENYFLLHMRDRFEHPAPDVKVAAVREGQQETIQYIRKDFLGEPLYYRLLTDSYSMSGTDLMSRRYMKLFVYWPMAVNPNIKHGLLIAYGVGSTAKAMTDTAQLESIDIVDTSKDIVDLSRVVYPDPRENPVNDRRVRLHIEDARFYLQTTDRHFDLITAEPPPPKNAGVVHLYTEEYFRLLHDHLSEGGVVTYWLPVQQLMRSETNAVMKAFCDVFEDCSLWAGSRLNMMLVGTRGLQTSAPSFAFARQWNDPVVKREMISLGIESPGQLAALLVADTPELREILGDSVPLTDNFPERLLKNVLDPVDPLQYEFWLKSLAEGGIRNDSPTIQRLWPESFRNGSGEYFKAQRIINQLLFGSRTENRFESLHWIITRTSLRMPVLFLMESDDDVLAIIDREMARGVINREFSYHLAVRSLAERKYDEAERHLSVYQKQVSGRTAGDIYLYRIYIQLLSGKREKAKHLAKEFLNGAALSAWPDDPGCRKWLKQTFRFNMNS